MPAPKDPAKREEWIRKNREAHVGKPSGFKGKRHTVESNKKNGDAHLGLKRSMETRSKMSESHKGQIPWNYGKTGIYSDEHLKFLSVSNIGNTHAKGMKHTDEWKKTKSLSQIGEKNPFYNKTHDALTRSIISKTNTGNKYRLGITHDEKTRAILREHRLNQIFPRKDTKPEKILQIALKLRNVEFIKHKRIIGQPDIFIEPNLCVFVDGDQVHGNPKLYVPTEKIAFGVIAKERWIKDQKITLKLINDGYYVLRIWESALKSDADKCVDFILNFKNKFVK